MRLIRTLSLAAAGGAVAMTGALFPLATAGASQQSYQYTFTNQNESDTFTDSGLCDPGDATISLVYNEALHVSATQGGLTQDEIEALLDEEGSDVLTKVTYTQTGQFVVHEASGVTYTGTFTSWFGGNVNRTTAEFSGTFSVRGTGDDGSRISGHEPSHVTFVNGDEVVSFDKGSLNGCASS